MDPAAPRLTTPTAPPAEAVFPQVPGLPGAPLESAHWLAGHWYLPLLAALTLWGAGEAVVRRLAARASAGRTALELTPSRHFDPHLEEILRHGMQLARASTRGPWWAPRRAQTVQIRLRADGSSPLRYRIEGPAGGERLLSITPFGPHVAVRKAPPLREAPRTHAVRAEFILRGTLTAPLREVPLDPDPLQPLIDAVTGLRADLGDLAEVRVNVQRPSPWALRAHRWRLMQDAHRRERRAAGRDARWMRGDAGPEMGRIVQQLLGGDTPGGRLVMPPAPRRIDPAEALGKLADDDQLVRVQLLVTCASDTEGRAEAHLAHIRAALDVFGGRSRWALRGVRLGPWQLGAGHWPGRRSFDQRWHHGHCRPPRANWVRLEELAGLLKPPTLHCRLPLLPADLPTFTLGDPALLLQGIYRAPDGRERLVATYAEDTLFECTVGKAGGGKTERALAQAIGWAHAGGGLMFVDPHRDSWPRAAPFLAHDHLMPRIALIDLNADGPAPSLSSWNPLAMQHGQRRHEVVEAVADAFASCLGWDDAEAPRAITVLTAALSVLVAVNEAACQAQRPEDQTTVFHIRALLTDHRFRAQMLATVAARLDEETRAWWQTTFPAFPADALGVVINPLTRLADNPVTRAFLGQPTGAYNARAAIDNRMIVWVCPAGNGPTDRLLTSLLARDLLRAVRSRRDTPPAGRVPFRLYFDELITLTGAAPDTIASMFEDFRKYRVSVHGMTQLLARLPAPVRLSLTQNASALATTAGSKPAVAAITAEWGDSPSAEEVAFLDRFQHYALLTVGGRRIGPLRLTGPHLDDVFAQQARPAHVAALEQAARTTAQALPLKELTARSAGQLRRVKDFLDQYTTDGSTAVLLQKGYR